MNYFSNLWKCPRTRLVIMDVSGKLLGYQLYTGEKQKTAKKAQPSNMLGNASRWRQLCISGGQECN